MSREFVDPRRWLAFRTHGAWRYLWTVQASVEDLRGAVLADQVESAAYLARTTVLSCLSILSLRTPLGEISGPHEADDVSFNPLGGVDGDLVREWLAAASRGLVIDWGNEKWRWFEEIKNCVAVTETALGFPRRLELLRSPRGLSTILNLARTWDAKLCKFGLPSALPAKWAPDRTDAEPGFARGGGEE